jgi:hypothetical protein
MKRKSIVRTTTVKPTSEDKGLEIAIRIKAYDNGQVYLDGTPMNGSTPEETWLAAAWTATEKIAELQRNFAKRRRQQQAA